jgi:hypothetical protein
VNRIRLLFVAAFLASCAGPATSPANPSTQASAAPVEPASSLPQPPIPSVSPTPAGAASPSPSDEILFATDAPTGTPAPNPTTAPTVRATPKSTRTPGPAPTCGAGPCIETAAPWITYGPWSINLTMASPVQLPVQGPFPIHLQISGKPPQPSTLWPPYGVDCWIQWRPPDASSFWVSLYLVSGEGTASQDFQWTQPSFRAGTWGWYGKCATPNGANSDVRYDEGSIEVLAAAP